MAGAWISAWSATSLSRVPAYPFRLSTCAAASRIRSLVRADLEPASSGAASSAFLGTSRIIGARLFPARRQPALVTPPGRKLLPRSRKHSHRRSNLKIGLLSDAVKPDFHCAGTHWNRGFMAFKPGPERGWPLTGEAGLRLGSISQTLRAARRRTMYPGTYAAAAPDRAAAVMAGTGETLSYGD